MEWKNVNVALPEASGPYIVSVKKEDNSGAFIFEYVAWYYEPGKKWIRQDPFADKNIKRLQEEITPMVLGWLSNVPVFAG